ncbi:MAG: hypothetical protein KF712_06840 [Akkermansiaceae bacterium]|nr:hypothetical protein [Akkermansiaceae bacterium]
MENPYLTPASAAEPSGPPPDSPEHIRRTHLNHEASVRSIGNLCYLAAIVWGIWLLNTVLLVPNMLFLQQQHDGLVAISGMVFTILVGVILPVAMVALLIFGGRGLRKLTPWGRVVGIVIAVIGLAAIPIGTILSIYALYLLLSKKGKMVFSPAYKEVMAATPEVKYRTSMVVWVVLGLFILLLLFAWFAPSMSRSG